MHIASKPNSNMCYWLNYYARQAVLFVLSIPHTFAYCPENCWGGGRFLLFLICLWIQPNQLAGEKTCDLTSFALHISHRERKLPSARRLPETKGARCHLNTISVICRVILFLLSKEKNRIQEWESAHLMSGFCSDCTILHSISLVLFILINILMLSLKK